jgi:hypothetical protein
MLRPKNDLYQRICRAPSVGIGSMAAGVDGFRRPRQASDAYAVVAAPDQRERIVTPERSRFVSRGRF